MNRLSIINRTSRMVFIVIWIGLLYLIASNIQAGWLYVVIAFFVMLAAVSVAYPLLMLRGLKFELHLPEYMERAAAGGATLCVRNPRARARYMIRVVSADRDTVFEPEAALFVAVPGRGAVDLPVSAVCARRGRLEQVRLAVTCGAPLGIFTALRFVTVTAHSLVHPNMSRAHDQDTLRAPGLHDPAPAGRMAHAPDPYHYSLRQYVPGDSLRLMHWKLTAQRGEPIIRCPERKITGLAAVTVDNLSASYAHAGDFETVLENALAAARHLLFDRSFTVTVQGTAAPRITLNSRADWERALRWFALIQLEAHPAEAERTQVPDLAMSFGPSAKEEAR